MKPFEKDRPSLRDKSKPEIGKIKRAIGSHALRKFS